MVQMVPIKINKIKASWTLPKYRARGEKKIKVSKKDA